MFNSAETQQDFKYFSENKELICHFCLDKIQHHEDSVWIMNAFFVNPNFSGQDLINQYLVPVLDQMLVENEKIWPLDPAIIAFLRNTPKYQTIWYQKPANA